MPELYDNYVDGYKVISAARGHSVERVVFNRDPGKLTTTITLSKNTPFDQVETLIQKLGGGN